MPSPHLQFQFHGSRQSLASPCQKGSGPSNSDCTPLRYTGPSPGQDPIHAIMVSMPHRHQQSRTPIHTFSNNLPNGTKICPSPLTLSGAPGSVGTYSPGIPSPPQGLVTLIRFSSTMFGCSLLPPLSTA